MKKIVSSLISLSLLVLPVMALAQVGGNPPAGGAVTLTDLGTKIVNAAWIVFTVFVVVCFVLAGILFLTASGDAEKVKTARNAFLWGVAGVVVGIIAYSIVTVVKNAF